MTGLAGVVEAVGEALAAAKDSLNEADSAAGDGDLGLTAERMGAALREVAPELPGLEPSAALRRAGLELARRAPSTFGTLISFGLLAAARSAAAEDAETNAQRLARLAAAMATGIEERGKAPRGAKTLLDALWPAAEALAEAASSGEGVPAALASASRAAASGAEETRTMRAQAGRAGWLADRSEGHADAGALAVALAIEAAARALGAPDSTDPAAG